MKVAFRAPELEADGSLGAADYQFEGARDTGFEITRNGRLHLTLGPGYQALRTLACGVCSTDLDRHHLPFPLPQVIGHEVVAEDEDGRRYAIEINASHAARGEAPCAFCEVGLERHCPERLVLGIHDLPGGFGAHVLAPMRAACELPPELPMETALLIEPFAAVLNAVERIAPRRGDTIAVLGPRRLGLLAIAALAGVRRRSGIDHRILAIARHPHLLEIAAALGADDTILSSGDGSALEEEIADVVIDTTANPQGLDLAVRLARREVHLKSTHGRPASGLARLTELVVDELSIGPLPSAGEAGSWLEGLSLGTGKPRVAWLVEGEPPAWLARADVRRGRDAAALLRQLESESVDGALPRADAAVVGDAAQIDAVIRPDPARETALVRPCGTIALAQRPNAVEASPLLDAVKARGLRLSGSRCGRFQDALALLRDDPALRNLGARIVTHHFPASRIAEAFATARTPACIKAVVHLRS